jgi:hypothetical protein
VDTTAAAATAVSVFFGEQSGDEQKWRLYSSRVGW